MKLWKKVYLLTLIIVTMCVNIGFYGIVYFTYNKMLEAEKERCQTEYIMMSQNLSNDILEMEKAIPLDEVYFEKYIKAYNSYCDENTKIYGVVKNSLIGEEISKDEVLDEMGIHIYDESQTVIYVNQVLDEEHKNYQLIMEKKLIDFDETWNTLLPLYLIGGIVLSLGVSIILAAAVRGVLRPMDRLEKAAKKMQEGDWSSRVKIQGNHELAKLGRQFNSMAESIEENIVKLEQQSKQKEELINNLAHEMNTPITSIKGFAEYMRMSELSIEEREECIDFIVAESKRLKDISNTLLSMARIHNEEETIEEFSIKDLCNRLEGIYEKEMKTRNITFSVDCKINNMMGNEILMESFLRNMIANAMVALDKKENKKIDINIFQEDNVQKIEIRDNGCGIDKEHIEYIFEPFYRVDKARSRERGGSGLGLPFCKKIVELHHGKLMVKSRKDEGTTFIATFTV